MGQFVVEIKPQDSSAKVIQGVKANLVDTEAAAQRASKAISSIAAAQASDSALAASRAFASLNDEFKREADILERINGPNREYMANLRALDALLSKNAISTEQYAQQVTKLNHEIEHRPKAEGGDAEGSEHANEWIEAIAGKGGEVGEILGGIATKGTLAAGAVVGLVGEIAHLIEESNEAKDKFTELTNVAQKFTENGRGTNDVIREQAQLGHVLQAGMEPTLALYDKIRDAGVEMNLTHNETIRLTRSLGEAVQLADKPLDAASGIMQAFSFAIQEGSISTRTLNTIMKEVPVIAETWKSSFHESGSAIVQDVASHRISVADLARSLGTNVEEMDKKWAAHKQTIHGTTEEITSNAAIMRQQGVGMLQSLADAFKMSKGEIVDHRSETDKAAQAINDLADETLKGAGAFKAIGAAQREAFGAMKDAIGDAVSQMQTLSTYLARGLGNDPWSGLAAGGKTGILAMLPAGTEAAMKYAEALGTARKEMTDLNAAHAAGAIVGEAFRKQYDALATTLNGGQLPSTIKIWNQLHDGVDAFHRDLDALEGMWRTGAVSEGEYARALAAITAENPALKQHAEQVKAATEAFVKQTNAAREAAQYGVQLPSAAGLTGPHFAQAERDAQADVIDAKKADARETAALADQEKLYLAVLSANETSVDKYRDAVGELQLAKAQGIITDEKYQKLLDETRERYDDAKLPAAQLAKAQDDINEKFNAGIYTAQEYAHALDQVAAKYDKSFGRGLVDGLRELQGEVTNMADLVKKDLVDAVHKGEDAFVGMVTTGKADFSQFASAIEEDLVRIIVRALITKTILAAINAMFPGAGIVAAPAVDAGVGSAMAASAPGHATGASWIVGGGGGTDSQLQMFRASPGERVTVTPAERQRDGGGSSGPITVRPTIINASDHEAASLAAMNTRAGEALIMNTVIKNMPMIKGHVKK